MDLSIFESDDQIFQYIKDQLDKIHTLDECRLYKEEQLQLSEEMFWFRNCIEWVIRSNQVILNIKYALTRCLEFVESMSWPLEETENKRFYAYYLEDAVYRNMVLWDMFRQLINEFYKCGYSESDNVNIFKFLKANKQRVGKAKVNSILNYLNSSNHKIVRENLRNSFTHSVDTTSSYIFHRNVNGKIQPQIDYLLPSHPFKNLDLVILDIIQLIEFISEIVNEMYEYRNTNLILLKISIVMPCGKVIDDSEYWNLRILKEKYEQIIVPCDISCDKRIAYNQGYVCKPIKVHYRRIHSKRGKINGTLTPTMTFAELEAAFDLNKEY